MKKLILMSGLAILMMASCKKKEEVPPPPPIEDPAPPPAPKPVTEAPPVTPAPPAEEPDGTSISVGNDGISLKNKKGDAKNDITISKKKTEVEIKKP